MGDKDLSVCIGAGVFFLSCAEGEQISFLFDCILRGISPSRGPFGIKPLLPGVYMCGFVCVLDTTVNVWLISVYFLSVPWQCAITFVMSTVSNINKPHTV